MKANQLFGMKKVPVFNLTDQRGLTLVEMLIALVLSSIIFMSAYQVISNLVQYQVRARVLNQGNQDSLLIANMVSQIIEKGLNQYDLFYRNQKATLFEGDPESLQIVSRAYSAHFDRPGFRVYRLFRRNGELYISHRAFDRNYLSNQQFEVATGLEIDRLSFQYYEDGNWVDEWRNDRFIPEYIRTSIQLPGNKPAAWTRGTGRR